MNNRIVILGGAESGVGAALLAAQKGYDVFLSDFGTISQSYKTELEQHGIPYEEGGHTEERILNAAEIIKSPGIPERSNIIRSVRTKGIPVISEIEFAFRYIGSSKLIAITGSNGKT